MGEKIILYSNNDKLQCPLCGRETDSLKRYKLRGATFYLLWFGVDFYDVTACPECMRECVKDILKKYIWKSNVFYPLTLLFGYIHYRMTYTKGHSKHLFND